MTTQSGEASNGALRRQSTILVVEDQEMVSTLLAEFLRDEGFRVLTAGNGAEGIRLFRRHKDAIRIVLSDIDLPDIDGCTAFRLMKEMNPEVEAIFVSGAFNDMIKKQLRDLGVRHFLSKPYGLKEIMEAIDQILQSRP